MSHLLTGTAGYPLADVLVPDDADTADAASVEVPFQGLTDRIATALARIGGNAGTSEWAYPATKQRFSLLIPASIHASPVYVPPAGAATAVTAALWRSHYLNAAGAGPGGRDLITLTGKAYTGLTFHSGAIEFGRLMPFGSYLVGLDVGITKGTAQATSTDRMSLSVVRRSSSGVQTTLVSSTTVTSGSGDQNIVLDPASPSINGSDNLTLYVTSSAGAAPGVEDFVNYIIVEWDDVGPRS